MNGDSDDKRIILNCCDASLRNSLKGQRGSANYLRMK